MCMNSLAVGDESSLGDTAWSYPLAVRKLMRERMHACWKGLSPSGRGSERAVEPFMNAPERRTPLSRSRAEPTARAPPPNDLRVALLLSVECGVPSPTSSDMDERVFAWDALSPPNIDRLEDISNGRRCVRVRTRAGEVGAPPG